MTRAACWLLLLAATLPLPHAEATAQSVQGVLQSFGLLGTWAPDCSEPPNPLHPHATYTAEPSGQASMSYESGAHAPRSAYAILGAERVAADMLRLREEWLHDHSGLEVTLRKFRGKVKVWLSREPDGKVLVRDGAVLATGYVSPWMTRCSG